MKHLRFGDLRTHQMAAVEVAEKMVKRLLAGLPVDLDIVASAVPGSGKTLMASLIAHILYEAGIINGALYLAPNKTLIGQVELGFTMPERNLPLRLVKSLDTLMQSSLGDIDTAKRGRRQRGHAIGIVTSYDWIRVPKNLRRLLQWAKDNRVLIIADEGHRLGLTTFDEEDDEEAGGDMESNVRGWAQAYQAIRDVARVGLIMSGTLFRNDGRPIAGVKYDDNKCAITQIRCSRHDALNEHSSRRIEFVTYDGRYEAKFKSGRQTIRLGGDDADARALSTFIDNWQYVTHILEMACRHYDEHWETQGIRSSQMLIICNRRKQAHKIERWLQERYNDRRRVVLALGDDEKNAQRVLTNFRSRTDGHILVTVAMTAEGFDAPGIDHLVLLTKKRSPVMLDQMVNRATRVDRNSGRSWNEQWAYVFGPADPRLMHFFQRYFEETAETYSDTPSAKTTTERSKGDAQERKMTDAPRVTITHEIAGAIDHAGSSIFPDDVNRRIEKLKRDVPELCGLPRKALASLVGHMQNVSALPDDVLARGVTS